MSTTSWRKSPSVIEALTSNPARYQFLQAVRLLQYADHSRLSSAEHKAAPKNNNEVAQYAPSTKEFIRFRTEQRLAFAASEVTGITQSAKDDKGSLLNQWNMTIAFMGLTGMSGILPYHYTETILQQLKNKNPSLLEFLELFNHRTISLFYRASTKYRLPIQYEKGKLNALKNKRDDFTQALLSISGLGTAQLNNRLLVDDEALLRYSGLLTQSVRTASGLRRMLSEHFEYPVTIDEFQGQWQELLPDLRSRLTGKQYPKGCNACLGKDAKLGSKGWFMQGKIIINVGPLNTGQFNTLKPGSKKLEALKQLVRFYVGIEQDFEINITLRRSDLTKKLTFDKKNRPILGWNSWFGSKQSEQKKAETIKIRVSDNS
ncbi:MAG: type VI secretion system baseplate subunit TssG [Gammaproteobacteria bacterium]|jgi:type VI secretion system protein ImpH